MEMLTQGLELLGPTLVALLTVPALAGLKYVVTFIDGWPAWAQQISAVLIAAGLAKLGALTNLVLPESLHLFTGETVEGLLAAAMAFGVHAGKKAKIAGG